MDPEGSWRMLDPEALRSREIGDDPYAANWDGQKVAPEIILVNADELEWQFQQRVTTWPKPTAGSGTTSATASGRARAGPIWRCGGRQLEICRGGSCCGN